MYAVSNRSQLYEIVANMECRYSVFSAIKIVPNDWIATGEQGINQSCLQSVDGASADMRQLSPSASMQRS
jgi:uncharacterized protein YbdZ (MbtH family)